MLQLSFEHVLLISLTDAVSCFRRFLHLLQHLVAPLQNVKSLLNIGQAEIHHLEISYHRKTHRIRLRFQRFSPVFCDARAQIAFSGKRNVLGRPEADIGEVAIAVAGKRPWTPHAELLYRNLGLGKC
jgi:hypothetical protein